MGSRLTPELRKQTAELHEQGLNAPEIARKLGVDSRTVKHYLNERPRAQSVELERHQRELEHRNDIRRRIDNLKKRLEFPEPAHLWVFDDTETGEPATNVALGFDGERLRWELHGSSYVIKLDEEFDCVIEHLRSSRRTAILRELDSWKQLGGTCVKKCIELRLWIEREAKNRTGLDKVPDTGPGQRGLLDGFCMSVYWTTLSKQDATHGSYNIVSTRGDLHLLNYASSYNRNLAWLHQHEIDTVKDIHQRLIRTCQNLSITVEVGDTIRELKRSTDSLHQRLDDFASPGILPGKCHLCPDDQKPQRQV